MDGIPKRTDLHSRLLPLVCILARRDPEAGTFDQRVRLYRRQDDHHSRNFCDNHLQPLHATKRLECTHHSEEHDCVAADAAPQLFHDPEGWRFNLYK